MITKFKIYTEGVEVTPNNTSGAAGDTSSRRDSDGFLRTGNDGGFGVGFTPKAQDTVSKSYKHKKRKKKLFKKNKKYKDDDKEV